jgi:hypothetical protein
VRRVCDLVPSRTDNRWRNVGLACSYQAHERPPGHFAHRSSNTLRHIRHSFGMTRHARRSAIASSLLTFTILGVALGLLYAFAVAICGAHSSDC